MEEFQKKLMELMTEYFSADIYSLREVEVIKNNDLKLHGICITERSSACGVNIYVEEMFGIYQHLLKSMENGSPWDKILEILVDQVERSKAVEILLPEMVADVIANFDYMQDKIIFRLLNVEKNKKYLENKAYIPFLNLAVCFYILANEPEKDKMIGSVSLAKRIVDSWGLPLESVFEVAKRNMMQIFPAKTEALVTVINKLMDDDSFAKFMNSPELSDSSQEAYILTNQMDINGAAVLCYDSVLRNFSDEHGGSNIYILPSSIHETILIPDTERNDKLAGELLDMVREVNQTCVQPDEVLADCVYYYNRMEDEISVCCQYKTIAKSGKEGE